MSRGARSPQLGKPGSRLRHGPPGGPYAPFAAPLAASAVTNTGVTNSTCQARAPTPVSAVPMEKMGEEAARMLLEMAREGVRRLTGRYIPARLIVRESWQIPASVIEEEEKSIAEEAKT